MFIIWAVGFPASLYHLFSIWELSLPAPLPLSQKRFRPGLSTDQTEFLSASQEQYRGLVGFH